MFNIELRPKLNHFLVISDLFGMLDCFKFFSRNDEHIEYSKKP